MVHTYRAEAALDITRRFTSGSVLAVINQSLSLSPDEESESEAKLLTRNVRVSAISLRLTTCAPSAKAFRNPALRMQELRRWPSSHSGFLTRFTKFPTASNVSRWALSEQNAALRSGGARRAGTVRWHVLVAAARWSGGVRSRRTAEGLDQRARPKREARRRLQHQRRRRSAAGRSSGNQLRRSARAPVPLRVLLRWRWASRR